MVNVNHMSDRGALDAIEDLFVGLKVYLRKNPEQSKDFLGVLIESLDVLDSEDFFGTEGWESGLGVEL